MIREKKELPKIIKETATQKFHRELKELKPLLPVDYRMRFFEMYPQYDTYRGGLMFNNVINGNSTDENIMDGLKKIYEQTKKNHNE